MKFVNKCEKLRKSFNVLKPEISIKFELFHFLTKPTNATK